MSAEPQQPFEDSNISDVDTARLALRGAVATLHTLQDLVASVKAENQELVVREKAWRARVETMEEKLAAIHARWQESQALLQDYKQEIGQQVRSEIALEEQEKWRTQIEQVEGTLKEWQRAREVRESELQRTKEVLAEREAEVQRHEKEKIAFEHKTQAEITALLEKSRQSLKDAVESAVQEKNFEIRDVKSMWTRETEELKDSLARMEIEAKLKEDALQKEFHQRRRELEAIWRQREAETWRQAEAIRGQTENALQSQLQSRLAALAKEREEQQVQYQQRLATLEAQHVENQKALQTVFEQKESEVRQRFADAIREKEGQLDAQRIQLEQQAVVRESELLARVRQEEETLRNQLRTLEAELRRSVDEEMARRQAALRQDLSREQEVLKAQIEQEKKALYAERDAWQQETAEMRSRLAQEWLGKEADLQQKQQTELIALQQSWDAKQNEWIQQHQVALSKAQEALAEQLSVMETAFVERRKNLETDVIQRQSDLETRAGEIDAERRQAWLQKESQLHAQYQALIQDEKTKAQTQLAAHKQQLDEDHAKQVAFLEQSAFSSNNNLIKPKPHGSRRCSTKNGVLPRNGP